MAAMTNETIAQYKDVYVFAEQVDNELSGIALELVSEGTRLAAELDDAKVVAVVVGSEIAGLADKLAEYGADKVILVDDPILKNYRTEVGVPVFLDAGENDQPLLVSGIGISAFQGSNQGGYFFCFQAADRTAGFQQIFGENPSFRVEDPKGIKFFQSRMTADKITFLMAQISHIKIMFTLLFQVTDQGRAQVLCARRNRGIHAVF